MSHDKTNNPQELIDRLHNALGFDFVGLAPVPNTEPPELMWKYASGNTNKRFERIVLPPGVGVMGIVYGSKRPLLVENVTKDIPRKDQYQYPIVAAEGLECFFALPLIKQGSLSAILLCAYRDDHLIDQALVEQTAKFIADTSSEYTTSTNNPVRPIGAQEEPTYDETTHKVLQAQEEERKRISRELHDGIAQEILLAQIELRKLKYLPPEEKDDGIERASEYLRQIMKHVNSIAVGLRPMQLDEIGLAPAIKAYGIMLQDAYGVTVSSQIDPNITLSSDHETALYRIFQEAATNACKYSRTETIEVTLKKEHETAILTVKDQGAGFDTQNYTVHGSGLGIAGMRERAELIGGTFEIQSGFGEGTLVKVALPLQRSTS